MITLMLAILGAWFVALFAGPAIYAAMGLAGVIPGLLMTVALMLGLFVYRDFRLADLPRVILDTVETTGVVMALVMTASLLGYCISVSRLPQVFGSALTALTATPLLYLLICNVLLLVIGFFMEAPAAMLVLIPILVPPALALGIDPVQFGLVFVLNLMIGTITPPGGWCTTSPPRWRT
jgi:TRAP-type C4-dicarboxylate transport system permease large subunit